MKTVVVGVDVPPAPIEPLRFAGDYCRLLGRELVGAVAYEPDQSEVPLEWYEEETARLRKQAEALMDAVATDVPHRVDLRTGEADDVISAVGQDECASLVVVGANGSGGFRSLGLGTVAHHLSHQLLTPLVIVPRLRADVRRGTVVVGLDGSPGDVSTLAWAVDLAERAQGWVSVVYASDPLANSYPHPVGATCADEREAVVRDQVAVAAARGTGVDLVVEIDDPETALTRVADLVDASVIVVGRKGAGHLRGALLGRVPARLPFRAGRPVAIVPRPTAS